MLSIVIEGFDVVAGRQQGYNGLPIKVHEIEGYVALTTAWEPTQRELEALNRGEPVVITILAVQHPPIKVEVRNAKAT